MSSYLTEPEWTAAFAQFGVQRPLSYFVADTHLLLVRRTGGTVIEGQAYYYIAATDELIRGDVIKWVERRRADAVIAQHQAEEAAARAAHGVLP